MLATMSGISNWKSAGPFVGVLALGFAMGAYFAPRATTRAPQRPPAQLPAGSAKVTQHALPQGQLLVIDVKATVPGVPEAIEDRRCFVWREPQQMTSSISCDPRAEVAVDQP